MVQCYSGGFAQIIFKDGSSEKGSRTNQEPAFPRPLTTGLPPDARPAVRESDYREYSTQFWEALCGTTRTGDKVQKPDYDGDGRTSMSEAHASSSSLRYHRLACQNFRNLVANHFRRDLGRKVYGKKRRIGKIERTCGKDFQRGRMAG